METPPPIEPTIEELAARELVEFTGPKASITRRVADYLISLSPEQRAALTAGLRFGEDADPGRLGWIEILPTRGAVLIDQMAEPEPTVQLHNTAKRKYTGRK